MNEYSELWFVDSMSRQELMFLFQKEILYLVNGFVCCKRVMRNEFVIELFQLESILH